MAVDLLAQALHAAHGHAGQPHQLPVAQAVGHPAGHQRAAQQAGDGGQVGVAR